jgi:hypothetical protein
MTEIASKVSAKGRTDGIGEGQRTHSGEASVSVAGDCEVIVQQIKDRELCNDCLDDATTVKEIAELDQFGSIGDSVRRLPVDDAGAELKQTAMSQPFTPGPEAVPSEQCTATMGQNI